MHTATGARPTNAQLSPRLLLPERLSRGDKSLHDRDNVPADRAFIVGHNLRTIPAFIASLLADAVW